MRGMQRFFRFSATWALTGVGLLGSLSASAAVIERVLPQGSVSNIRQVQVDFSQPVVPVGQPDATVPVSLACEGFSTDGQGRWLNEKRWVFDFENIVPPGVRCTVKANSEFRALDASAITGFTPRTFNTGGPVPIEVLPYRWNDIDEQQHFLVEVSGRLDRSSVLKNVWCTATDVGERIPVRFLTDEEQKAVITATWRQ